MTLFRSAMDARRIGRSGMALLCAVVAPMAFAQRPGANDTAKVTIKKIAPPINSPFNDYAPLVSADGSTMLFTSNRPVTEREKQKAKPAKENVYQVLFDEKKRKWGLPTLLGESVNAPARNNSAIAISPDGQHMLVYRDDDQGNGNIFESALNGTEWSELVELGEPVNSPKHESSACYSPDGRSIYFVSDREGGVGKKDIYKATRQDDGSWGAAECLDRTINTKEDEQGVFLSTDGRLLYFSSKGHGGSGGYDLFRSTWAEDHWETPVNLGAPINTIDDDLYLVLMADGRNGYFSSVRSGGLGLKDIYEVKITPKPGRKTEEPKLTVLKGQVIDEETRLPVEAAIQITDNATRTSVSDQRSNSSSGNFLLPLPTGKDYGISVSATGYLFHSENINMPDTGGYKEVVKVIELKKLKAGKTIVLNNVFYDFDRSTLRPESSTELDALARLLRANPTLRVELGSHTDSKGSDAYNLTLSAERAKSVVDHLIAQGIAADRLVAKGYGESQPVGDNETESGRQLNRRTEFKILE